MSEKEIWGRLRNAYSYTHLTLVRPWLEQSALLDHLAPVVNAGARGVAVDRDCPSVGTARVLTHHHSGRGAQE